VRDSVRHGLHQHGAGLSDGEPPGFGGGGVHSGHVVADEMEKEEVVKREIEGGLRRNR
jgi:hypothetical protein